MGAVTVLASAVGCGLVLVAVRLLAKRRSWALAAASGLAMIAVGSLAFPIGVIVWAVTDSSTTRTLLSVALDIGPNMLLVLLCLVALVWVVAVKDRFPQRVLDRALRHYADFRGRSRRSEWAWFNYVLTGGVQFAAASPLIYPLVYGREMVFDDRQLMTNLGVCCVVATWGLLIPSLAVAVRRLHDTGRSGWLVLLNPVPIAGLVVLVFCLLPGTPGENRFGPDPRTTTAP